MAHGEKETMETSPWADLELNPDIYLQIADRTVSSSSTEVNVRIVNGSEHECGFEDKAFLEQEQDGSWYSVAEIYNTLESAWLLPSGESSAVRFPLCEDDDVHNDFVIERAGRRVEEISLSPGHYRMVMVVYLYDDDVTELPVGVEFVVQ